MLVTGLMGSCFLINVLNLPWLLCPYSNLIKGSSTCNFSLLLASWTQISCYYHMPVLPSAFSRSQEKNNVGTSFMHTPIGCSPDYPLLGLAQPSCKESHKFNNHFLTIYCSPHPDPNLNFPLLQYRHIKTPHQAPTPYHCLSLCLEKLKLRRNLINVPF